MMFVGLTSRFHCGLHQFPKLQPSRCIRVFFITTATPPGSQRVKIGHVELPVSIPSEASEYLIPSQYLKSYLQTSPILLSHLQWMMKKDILGQDMFLVGPPGAGAAYRRRLVMAYAEMVQKPVEILTLNGDMTESDLKQRRELVTFASFQGSLPNTTKQTAIEFRDQAPVRAAKNGHLLLLDGLERAERNVLPTLNNLLENREMQLEDGTFLISPQRFQKLRDPEHNLPNETMSTSLIPVHPDFRVVALGVPTPPYAGRSLDPPIRSRFQIRRVDSPTSEELYESLMAESETTTPESTEIVKFCATLGSALQAQAQAGIPEFPFTSLSSISKTLQTFPLVNDEEVLRRAYPALIFSHNSDSKKRKSKGQNTSSIPKGVRSLLASRGKEETYSSYSIQAISPSTEEYDHQRIAQVSFTSDGSALSLNVPCGSNAVGQNSPSFVDTIGTEQVLSSMMQEHANDRDLLLIAPKGEGKNAVAQRFATLLGYNTHLFAMYREISSLDLLLRRSTDQVTGNTTWDESPLLKAAARGDVCLLDGVEKLRPDVLASLQSLVMDREISLPDGRRVLGSSHHPQRNFDDDKVFRIHPSFRIIALASMDSKTESRWITSDTMSMFSTFSLPSPSEDCYRAILRSVNPLCPDNIVSALLLLQKKLTGSTAEDCGVSPLSTRNMLRIVRRLGSNSQNVGNIVSSILLKDLLPVPQRELLESILDESGFENDSERNQKFEEMRVDIDTDFATIGTLKIQRSKSVRPEMVPSPESFFEIPAHVNVIRDLFTDYLEGERAFLLLGNQGVGKNMITDRICELANWEREYIQLHRDSTIGQLTLTPTLEDGKILWKDSPLVRAVRDGCVLVVDEADKAPVEVISVLKGLVEDGELLLADGRRISRHHKGPDIIPVHPDFSLWVLANRPGFPFLGNNFFREIGDCFSVRVIQNPDLESEIHLLQSYGPSIEKPVLDAVARSFAYLRRLADHGEINYPYSTREAVAVVKHLERFKESSMSEALENVLDFDSFDDSVYSILSRVFRRHGIQLNDYPMAVNWKKLPSEAQNLRLEYLGKNQNDGKSHSPPKPSMPKTGKWDDKNDPHVGGNQWAGGTGGSDTAGLGGRDGPFRLDRGHKVHQVSDEAKAEVSEEAAKAARKMARAALREKLEQIGMSEDEWKTYQEFCSPIKQDIKRLRAMLGSTVSKSNERGWVGRQSYGEIDDARLVDGVTGDKYIFKRRATLQDSPSTKPKHLRFVVDCSASMYRFNGYDERLRRCLEAALLVMESFEGFEERYKYSIVGHSGDSYCLNLVEGNNYPKDENERMRILQKMIAHSQYCQSGDFTLEALGHSINEIKEQAAESNDSSESIVIAISDANLARYGIEPKQLGKIIEAGERNNVKAFCIFIASFGDEAEEIKRSLPAGRGQICFQTSDLRKIVRDILSSNIN